MTRKFRETSVFLRIGMLLLAVSMIFCLSPQVFAAETGDGGWTENIVLTGEYTGKFTLSSNTSEIFNIENALPGNSWEGKITVKNNAARTMEVSLVDIESNLDDLALYNALELEIEVNSEIVYSGGYGATPDPVSMYYKIRPGEQLIFHVTVTFPEECGNDFMGKEMDSNWTFEARYPDKVTKPDNKPDEPDKTPVQTGNEMADSNTTGSVFLIMAILCLVAAVVTFLRVYNAKSKVKEK